MTPIDFPNDAASADGALAASIPTALPEAEATAPAPLLPLPVSEGAAEAGGGGPRVTQAPIRGMLSIKADLARPDVQAFLSQLVGGERIETRTARFRGETGVLWMAPDEVLVMTPRGQEGPTATHAALALAETHHLIIDVSDMRAVFRLTGAGARETLAKGAPIDLHPDSFGVGDLRRTRISAVAAALYQTTSAPETFEVICFRSYAAALWAWLSASAHPAAAPQVFNAG